MKKTGRLSGLIIALFFLTSSYLSASAGSESIAQNFLWIALILLIAKLASVVQKFGQASVLGELIAGIVIGNMTLIGITFFEPMKSDEILHFLSELGVVILLFLVGLESDLRALKKVGLKAVLVAISGVVAPFALGTWVLAPILFDNSSPNSFNAALFLGATLTATSIGITARVFQDLRFLESRAAQIVLGAAVLDDVIGLIILSVVQTLVISGSLNLAELGIVVGKSILFLGGGLIIGSYVGKSAAKVIAFINSTTASKLSFALMFCLLFSWAASLAGLAPIIGAFTAGAILDEVFFKNFDGPDIISKLDKALIDVDPESRAKVRLTLMDYSMQDLERIITPIGNFLVPIFFVYVGLNVNLAALASPAVMFSAFAVAVVAVVGKLFGGVFADKGERLIVGWGMVPRGEVGLIFATVGKTIGVVGDEMFSVIIVAVVLTTIITPPMLSHFVKKRALADVS